MNGLKLVRNAAPMSMEMLNFMIQKAKMESKINSIYNKTPKTEVQDKTVLVFLESSVVQKMEFIRNLLTDKICR